MVNITTTKLTEQEVQDKLYKQLVAAGMPVFGARQIAYQLMLKGFGPAPEISKEDNGVIIDYPTTKFRASAGAIDFLGGSSLQIIERKNN